MTDPDAPVSIGRYLLHRQIARGGMATIHIARVVGDVGFSRIVAAKRLRPELAQDREFVTMFLDEARIASKVHHRNVVPVLDVGTAAGEVVLVQEMVHGAPLSMLLKQAYESKSPVPMPVAVSIACQVLAGLHAAHETSDELGAPLRIIHRDVSPQNIMIATDGTARLLDFGVAKAAASAHVTRKGTFKGKLAYAAPEQIRGKATRQTDIWAASVVLWELVVGDRLWRDARSEDDIIIAIMKRTPPLVTEALASERAAMSGYRWNQLELLAPIIAKGLASDARRRWQTAEEMEEALSAVVPLASGSDVSEWLHALAGNFIDERDRLIAEEEAQWRAGAVPVAPQKRPHIANGSGGLDPKSIAVEPPRRGWTRKQIVAVIASCTCATFMVFALLAHALGTAQPPSPPAIALPPVPTAPPPAPTVTHVEPEPPAMATVAKPKPAPKPAPPRVAPRPRLVPKPAPPENRTAGPPDPRIDCNPPYFYEGAKKVFKAACI